jgi:hypothetical protein
MADTQTDTPVQPGDVLVYADGSTEVLGAAGGTAGSPTSTTTAQQAANLELRTSLSDAYAAVEGDKTTQSFNAITFEELAQQQITRLTTAPTPNRPSPLQAIQNVLTNVKAAVTQIQAQSPASFAEPNATQDVNPPV